MRTFLEHVLEHVILFLCVTVDVLRYCLAFLLFPRYKWISKINNRGNLYSLTGMNSESDQGLKFPYLLIKERSLAPKSFHVRIFFETFAVLRQQLTHVRNAKNWGVTADLFQR